MPASTSIPGASSCCWASGTRSWAVNPRLDADVAYEYSTAPLPPARSTPRARSDPPPGHRDRRERIRPLGHQPPRRRPGASTRSGRRPAACSLRHAGLVRLATPCSSNRVKNTTTRRLLPGAPLHRLQGPESLVLAEYNGGPLNAGYLRAGDGRLSAETRQLRGPASSTCASGCGRSSTRPTAFRPPCSPRESLPGRAVVSASGRDRHPPRRGGRRPRASHVAPARQESSHADRWNDPRTRAPGAL